MMTDDEYGEISKKGILVEIREIHALLAEAALPLAEIEQGASWSYSRFFAAHKEVLRKLNLVRDWAHRAKKETYNKNHREWRAKQGTISIKDIMAQEANNDIPQEEPPPVSED